MNNNTITNASLSRNRGVISLVDSIMYAPRDKQLALVSSLNWFFIRKSSIVNLGYSLLGYNPQGSTRKAKLEFIKSKLQLRENIDAAAEQVNKDSYIPTNKGLELKVILKKKGKAGHHKNQLLFVFVMLLLSALFGQITYQFIDFLITP